MSQADTQTQKSFGQEYRCDPKTGELIVIRELTQEEALETQRQFFEKFNWDGTSKVLREYYRKKSDSAQKSQP